MGESKFDQASSKTYCSFVLSASVAGRGVGREAGGIWESKFVQASHCLRRVNASVLSVRL